MAATSYYDYLTQPRPVAQGATAAAKRAGVGPYGGASYVGAMPTYRQGTLAQGVPLSTASAQAQAQAPTPSSFPTTQEGLQQAPGAPQSYANTAYGQLGPGGYPIPQYALPGWGSADYSQWYKPLEGEQTINPWTGETTTDQAAGLARAAKARAYQASAAGPELSWLLPTSGKPLQYRDLPWLDVRLQYQNQQLGEQDRAAAYDALQRAYYQVGGSPEAKAALQAAMQLLQEGGPYNPQRMDILRGELQNKAGYGYEAAQRAMAEDFARRGLGGSATSAQLAGLQQQSRSDLQSQIASLEDRAALANQEAQRANIAGVYGMSSEQEARRQAIMQAIAQLYAETERAPIDLSGLAAEMTPERSKSYVRYVW